MNVVAEAVTRIPVTRLPNDRSDILYYLQPKQQFQISGIRRVGYERDYCVQGGGYVSTQNIHIIRDMDFYYKNLSNKDKIIMKHNISTAGGRGISAAIARREDTTDLWFDLMKFADPIIGVETIDYKEAIARGYGGGFGGGINMNGSDVYRTTTKAGSWSSSGIAGGIMGNTGGNGTSSPGQIIPPNGTTVPTASTNDYRDNVLKTPLSSIAASIGGGSSKTSSTIGSLLKGTTVKDLTDGSFLGKVGMNALSLLGGWTKGIGESVAGFGSLSTLSSLFNKFGSDWQSALSAGLTMLFGSGGVGFMNNITGAYGLTNVTNTRSVTPTSNGAPMYTSGYGVKFFSVSAGEGDRYPFRYANVTQQMIDYFKYKGCDGRTVIKTYAGLTWEQDASYATPTLQSQKYEPDIQLWNSLYNADYSEMRESVETIKEAFNISAIPRQTLFVNFNRYRYPIPDHELTGTRGHIFFSRPDLNLNLEQSRVNGLARCYPVIHMVNGIDPYVAGSLTSEGPPGTGNHQFCNILSHACTGIDVADEVLETVETGETYTGWKLTYGTSLNRSKTAGNVSCTFRDDNMLSVYKIMKIWCEYINSVYHGEYRPDDKYFNRHELDYAIAIYYFLTRNTADGEILFWTKYTGCYPTAIPSSNFGDSQGNIIKSPTYTVQFNYAKKDDYSPVALYSFNDLSEETEQYVKVYDEKSFRTGTTFVGAPYVSRPTGSSLYYLRYRPA